MVRLRVTREFIIDTLTPGMIKGPIELIEGLPKDIDLIDVSMKDGIVQYDFDDGNEEITPVMISWSRPEDIKEGTV